MERKLKGGAIRYKTFQAMEAEDNLQYIAEKALTTSSIETIYSAKGAYDEDRVKRFIGTSEVKDRDGEILVIDGMDFKNFKKNPIVLFAHQTRDLPLGKVVKVEKDNNKKIVYFDVYFAKANPLSETILALVDEGVIKSTSLGFRVTDWEYDEKAEAFMLTKSEIFEISIVPVPANQDAILQESKELEDITTKAVSNDELADLVRGLAATVANLYTKVESLEPVKPADEVPPVVTPEVIPEVIPPVEVEKPAEGEVIPPVETAIDMEAIKKFVLDLMSQHTDETKPSEEDNEDKPEVTDPSPETTDEKPSNEDAEHIAPTDVAEFESLSVEQLDSGTQFVIVNEEEN